MVARGLGEQKVKRLNVSHPTLHKKRARSITLGRPEYGRSSGESMDAGSGSKANQLGEDEQ
jgi:hypothetical protein